MADSDSDGEFERFLQEDEDSLSPEPMARRSKPSGVYTSSSASAVTAAAAALLASSKLTKKHKSSKNKSSDKKKSGKRSSKTHLSDSDEAPPNYNDEYATRRGGGVEDSDSADPYAFDMTASAIPSSTKEEEEDIYSLKKKKTKEEFKSLVKKAVVKSAPISMQDRIAEILKRTGSTQLQADDKSDEEDVSDKEVAQSDEKDTTPLPSNSEKAGDFKQSRQDYEKSDAGDSSSDAEHSSLSDSLGVSASDFEVHLPAKPSLDRKRLSLSSLDSEQFAVNMDALNDNLGTKIAAVRVCRAIQELIVGFCCTTATPSRYEQQMSFLKSEQDEDSPTEKDDYGDDDFELDHSTLGEEKAPPPPYFPVQDEADEVESEKPFVGQFEKMKELSLPDPVAARTEEVSAGSQVQGSPDDSLSASADDHHNPLDASDTFGYGDEEFEETEGSRQENPVASGSEDKKITEPAQNDPQATNDVESSVDYEDDAFEADAAIPTEVSSAVPPDMLSNERTTSKSSKMEALLAKYGDFYTLEEEPAVKESSNEEALQKAQTQEVPSALLGDLPPSESTILALSAPVATTDSPPSSPPPPPPPDEDEEDDQELNRFTLEAPRNEANTTTSQGHSQASSAADRFRQIESHVASLRFIQPTGTPSLTAANSPATEAVHPVSSKLLASHRHAVPPPLIEPLSISFDAGLLAEDDETQQEIDELVRSSQVLRQEKRSAAQRANIARESGLVLRLQQAQRQILQLKEHIQTTAGESPVVNAKQSEEEHGDRLDSEELRTARDKAAATSQGLEKEIKIQDNLIAAFQKENERLMQQLKQVRQDVHYDVHEANEELRRQVKKLQDQAGEVSTLGGGGDLTSKAQYRVAVEARLEAEAHAMALQDDLAAVKLSYQQKLNEVTLELDRVKKAKVELECRYEGVDLTQVAQDTQQARELQKELELCKKEHAHALSTLQKKLDWYVENQRLLDDQDDELRRLRRQVATQSSETPTGTPSKEQRANSKPSPARSHRRSPNDIRRIQELESRLSELEEAMRRRHPDSLANLILASRRADEESTTRAQARDYEDKVAQLSRELEQAHEASETRLSSFRQQQEKLLLQYRRKIKEQEKQLKQLSKAPLSHRATAKDTASSASDAEVPKVRRFYAEKIKELERKWEAKYRALRKQQYAGLGSNQQAQEGLTYADSALVMSNLQRQLRQQEQELKQEKARVEQLEAESQLAGTRPEDSPRTEGVESQRELEHQVADLKAQLEDSESARARLAQTLTTVQTLGLARALNADATPAAPVVESPVLSQQTEAELVRLREELSRARDEQNSERLAAATKVGKLEQQAAEFADTSAQREAQLAGNEREMQSLQRLAMEAERHNRALEAQAKRVPELEEEAFALRRELELPRTPSMVQYRSLELKVATLEQKHKLREAELKVVLDRALTSTHLEQLSRERAHRAAMAAKNAEIAAFKRQLEEILDELALLQQPPSTRLRKTMGG